MLSIKKIPPALLLLPLAIAITAAAQSLPPTTTSAQAPALASRIAPPRVNVPASAADQFERNPILSLPGVFVDQNTPGTTVPPEGLISQEYLRTADNHARKLSLKEAIYIAIRNNPALAATQLGPIGGTEAIRQANGAFDPDLTSQLDISKSVAPVSSAFQVRGSDAFTQKFYDWNFGINKVLASTNGILGLTFDNNRTYSNSTFASVNPSYTPAAELSLVQPLLRNFGWDFARINVHLAESAQRSAQWTYGSALNDFVQRIGGDYWGVVGAVENLAVADSALKFNGDLVRVNAISLKVGTLAPIDLQEAQSAASTAEANVYAAQAALQTARAQLREDVMLNPNGTFIPQDVEPADTPNPHLEIRDTEEAALENMVEYSPALGGLREAIRTSLLQVKFAQNQTLPQLSIGAQFGVTAVAGTTPCVGFSSAITPGGNCDRVANTTPPPAFGFSGNRLPFGGIYGDALNRMLDARFYNYAGVLSIEMPLDNASAKAALAQARVSYEQARLQYRSALSQSVAQIESALANLHADIKRVKATEDAAGYAAKSLHDENVRFRVGLATTHDLLQFQSELVTAQGNQVQADVDLENARLALWHAEGTLLGAFNIEFQLQDPRESPWYATF
ncbi:MAG TPA: TolC family protein [Candidatus Binataceae bacterium]|nr:TolC family protein [Candidatus Binataceae bacterium]